MNGVFSGQACLCIGAGIFVLVGSFVVLSVCGSTNRSGSDARTQHFRRFYVTVVSTATRQEDHAQRHRNR